MDSGEHEEMTAAAIARLAGVGRAAVSNWRRRYPEFPKPVGGSPTSPTFDVAEVEADSAEDAAALARENHGDYKWEHDQTAEFDARFYVTLDADGDEIENRKPHAVINASRLPFVPRRQRMPAIVFAVAKTVGSKAILTPPAAILLARMTASGGR